MYIRNNCLYYEVVDNTVDLDFRDFMKENIKKRGARWDWNGKCWKLPISLTKQVERILDEYYKKFVCMDDYSEEDLRKEYKELFG